MNGWTRVEDRLPERWTPVLVWGSYSYTAPFHARVGTIQSPRPDDGATWTDLDGTAFDRVTHWRDLPPAPAPVPESRP